MAIDGSGNLHVVWESDVGGPVQYVKVDPDGNLSRATGVRVTQTAGTGNDLPDIAIDSAGHVHVVYTSQVQSQGRRRTRSTTQCSMSMRLPVPSLC